MKGPYKSKRLYVFIQIQREYMAACKINADVSDYVENLRTKIIQTSIYRIKCI